MGGRDEWDEEESTTETKPGLYFRGRNEVYPIRINLHGRRTMALQP